MECTHSDFAKYYLTFSILKSFLETTTVILKTIHLQKPLCLKNDYYTDWVVKRNWLIRKPRYTSIRLFIGLFFVANNKNSLMDSLIDFSFFFSLEMNIPNINCRSVMINMRPIENEKENSVQINRMSIEEKTKNVKIFRIE